MMEYEMFKAVVEEKFKSFLGKEYENMEVDVRPVDKVNRTLDGLTVTDPSESTQISPTTYINDLYEDYKKTGDLDATLRNAADAMKSARIHGLAMADKLDYTHARESIIFQLINTEQNKSLLSDVPHRQFQDLSIIYRWVVEADKDAIASAVIHNSLAAQMGLDEEELFMAAVDNTKRLLKPTIRSMSEVLSEMFSKDGMPDEVIEQMIGEMPEENQMYIISNSKGINGAISMLYEDGLHELAEKIGTDLYIMPSSVHEVIAVSAEIGDPDDLAHMVEEINRDQVAIDERLSNQVYHYDKELRKISLATDTPNKRLDSTAPQQDLVFDQKEKSR